MSVDIDLSIGGQAQREPLAKVTVGDKLLFGQAKQDARKGAFSWGNH